MSITSPPPQHSGPTEERQPERHSRQPWWIAGGVFGLALGYFLWYTPYAALTKALSSGLIPGMDKEVGGLVLLPAAALGTLVGAPLFLMLSGWWRYIGIRQVFGRMMAFPSRTMIVAGFFTSLVIAATTLNYTFAGVSILFMLLMMRAGVLILSPVVDKARKRQVRVYSWVALGFSLLAVVTALVDVNSYHLTVAAVISLSFYFIGYIGRFEIMSRVAKSPDENVNRRYFAEEAVSAAVWQVLLCAVVALIGVGKVSDSLREGFTGFLFSPAALPAFGVGLLYSMLYVYGTLIYLDRREYTWCVPANRCSSLLSGVVASLALTWLVGVALPGVGQFVATGFVLLAIAALSYPAIRAAISDRANANRPLLLFVCGSNTCRSPMAEAIARGVLAEHGLSNRWQVISAGLDASPGLPMIAEAMFALDEMGVDANGHQARRLTPELIRRADMVYCMTKAHCDAVTAMAPEAAGKMTPLDADCDIADPHGKSPEDYRDCAEQIRRAVEQRVIGLSATPPLRASRR